MLESRRDSFCGDSSKARSWPFPIPGPCRSGPGAMSFGFGIATRHGESFTGSIRKNVFEQVAWVELAELPTVDMLEGNNEVVELLVKRIA